MCRYSWMRKINPRTTVVSAPRNPRAHLDVMSFTGRDPVVWTRRKPARNSSANRAETTSRLLGSARITMCSDWLQPVHHTAGDMPQPTGHPMPLHGRSHGSRNDQSHLRRIGRLVITAPHIDDQIWLHGSSPVLHRGIEIGRPRHAVPRGKHRCDTRLANQAVSERRPLRRRFDTTARPALVRIRRRKPCTRARRRLFGWKVRLPFATTLSSLHLASRSGPVTPCR